MLPRISQLLQNLYPKVIREVSSFLSTTQEGREGLSNYGASRAIQRNQQRPR